MNYPHHYCAPGEQIPAELKEKLAKVNADYTSSGNFQKYRRDIAATFGLSPVKITHEHKQFIGGFIEGEGSLNVSAKKLANAKYGILVDPEFSITQHVNGVVNLYNALDILQAGRIRHKSGSNATLVLIIDNRVALAEKVLPFYNTYVMPFGSAVKTIRQQNFAKVLQLLHEGCHLKLDCLANELLPLWDEMRMQRGQSNEAFPSLEAAQAYVRDVARRRNTGAS